MPVVASVAAVANVVGNVANIVAALTVVGAPKVGALAVPIAASDEPDLVNVVAAFVVVVVANVVVVNVAADVPVDAANVVAVAAVAG